jgi:hypothetical protein
LFEIGHITDTLHEDRYAFLHADATGWEILTQKITAWAISLRSQVSDTGGYCDNKSTLQYATTASQMLKNNYSISSLHLAHLYTNSAAETAPLNDL